MDLFSIWQGNELHNQGRFSDASEKYLLVSELLFLFEPFIYSFIHSFIFVIGPRDCSLAGYGVPFD